MPFPLPWGAPSQAFLARRDPSHVPRVSQRLINELWQPELGPSGTEPLQNRALTIRQSEF